MKDIFSMSTFWPWGKCIRMAKKSDTRKSCSTMVQNSLMSQGWHFGSEQPDISEMVLESRTAWYLRDGTMVHNSLISQGWHYGPEQPDISGMALWFRLAPKDSLFRQGWLGVGKWAQGSTQAKPTVQTSEWVVQRNEQMEKQVALYSHLDSWLFWTIVNTRKCCAGDTLGIRSPVNREK